MGFGVAAGARKPFHGGSLKPGNSSSSVGASGSCGIRLALETKINLILSLPMCGSSSAALPKYICT
jgi:hypothetical protein